VQQAKIKLARTRIRAPYAGRILKKQVDIGQFVSTGTVLASIYAVDYVEIRLPLTDQQAPFVKLPEAYQNEKAPPEGPEVTLLVNHGPPSTSPYRWKGKIMRTEGAIDIQSRQQFMIAQVNTPYARHKDNRPPLKVGQFVQAEIRGDTLTNVIVLPRNVLRGDDEVLVVSENNTIERRKLEVLWRDDQEVVIRHGLKAGERISKTPLSFATNGMRVKIRGNKTKARKMSPGKDH